MKIFRGICLVAVLSVAGIWIWRHGTRTEDASASLFERNRAGSSAMVKGHDNPKLAKLRPLGGRLLDKEGERLVRDARKALEVGDLKAFHQEMVEIIHRYKGDPNPLVLEFIDLLDHDDVDLRIRMAGIFLLTGLETNKAETTLRDIVRSDKPLIYGPEKNERLNEEFPSSDFRFRAADVLALYHVEAAKDEIWALYEASKSDELIRPLRRLNDHRMIEKLKGEALGKPESIRNMELIGEFRFVEALPTLKSRYEDKSLNPDLYFRTLYSLWRITGEKKYFDEFASAFLPAKIPVPYLAVGGEEERQYLIRMLETERSDILIKATMALHLRYKDDGPIIKMLLEYYRDLRSSPWKDGTLARRLVGSIGDPELTRVAEEYEAKYQTGFHDRNAVYRKNWRYPEWEETLFFE